MDPSVRAAPARRRRVPRAVPPHRLYRAAGRRPRPSRFVCRCASRLSSCLLLLEDKVWRERADGSPSLPPAAAFPRPPRISHLAVQGQHCMQSPISPRLYPQDSASTLPVSFPLPAVTVESVLLSELLRSTPLFALRTERHNATSVSTLSTAARRN